MLLETIINNLKTEGLLQQKTHVVLGYSGGIDSTALLFLLSKLRESHPLEVTAVYYDHHWRGSPPAELPLIHQNCLRCQVPLVMIEADRTLPKTETIAREHRYRELTRLASDLGAQAVLTAHHADDQVETILFRVLRGTGLDGLVGIQKRLILEEPFGEPIPILRPLLNISRDALTAYIQESGIPFFEDPSNQSLKHQRNLIRHHILPTLEQHFPQVKNTLFKMGLVAESDLEILEEAITPIWDKVYQHDPQGAYLDAVVFSQLALPYQRRILKRFLQKNRLSIDFQTIEDTLTFIHGETRHNLDSALKSLESPKEGFSQFLSLYKNKIRVVETATQRPVLEPTPLSLEALPETGVVDIPAFQASLTLSEVADGTAIKPSQLLLAPESLAMYLNLEAFKDKPLEIRNRRPGDKFHPVGLPGAMRLKKYLMNRGVPRFERDKIPLLVSGQDVLWAIGLGLSQQVQGTPTHHLIWTPNPATAPPREEARSLS